MEKVISNSSLAHTVGNVTSLFTEYIKSIFPADYFHHVHVNSRMAYREQKREENSKYEFIKKAKPILIIRPRIDFNNSDIFMAYSFFTTNLFGVDYGNDSNFLPLFVDKDKQCGISYLMNRIRVAFDCTIMVDTEFEQINQYAYILNTWTPERFYRMDTALEVFIPSSIVELVSAYSGVPINSNETGTVKPFLDYLNSHTNKYITYKERTSTSTQDFFTFYPCSIDYVVTDITKDDPNKKSWSSYSCNINFSLSTEFNTIGIYEFKTLQPKKEVIMDLSLNSTGHPSNDGINIIPQFTIGNLFSNTKLNNGFELFFTQSFETDPSKNNKTDILELSSVFENTNVKDIVEWHKKTGISNNVFLQFIIMENNKKLDEEKDYTIDWDNQSISILKSNPDKTYRLAIFLNNLYVNNLLENYNNISSSYEQPVGYTTDKMVYTKKDNNIGLK